MVKKFKSEEYDTYLRSEAIEEFGLSRVKKEVDNGKVMSYQLKVTGKEWQDTRLRDVQKGDLIRQGESGTTQVLEVIDRPYIIEDKNTGNLTYMVYAKPYRRGGIGVKC